MNDNKYNLVCIGLVLLFLGCIILSIILTPDNYEKIKISDTESTTIPGTILDDTNTLEICLYTAEGIVINKTYQVNDKIIKNEKVTDTFLYKNLIPGTTYYIKSSIYNSTDTLVKENYNTSFIPNKEEVMLEIDYIG